jgi:hypothetical protein
VSGGGNKNGRGITTIVKPAPVDLGVSLEGNQSAEKAEMKEAGKEIDPPPSKKKE